MKYHKDIYLPEIARNLEFVCLLDYTPHALREAQNDRYGAIKLPKVFDTRQAEMIDVTLDGETITRALYRMDYDEGRDLCLVIEPNTRKGITVWLNEKTDTHATLDKTRYAVE